MNLWQRIASFLATIFGKQTMPPEVQNGNTSIQEWWAIYRAKAPWLSYSYVTSDAVKREHRRLTLNPAKIACSELAGLVLSETPAVTASQAVMDVLQAENFWANLRRSYEYQAAIGGQALKLVKEGDEICIDFVKASNFIPLTWDNAEITEASFIDRRSKGKDVFIRVETHKKTEGGYTITSAAFDEKTGIKQNLEVLWPDVEPEVFVATSVPLFVYIGNPEANNIDPESPLGISIFANATDTIQALDVAFDEFNWEILAGQRRIAIPGTCMRGYVDTQDGKRKNGFNPGDRVFMRLEGDDAEKFKPTDMTSPIREQSFIASINALLNLYAMQIGFNAGYFSFDGVSMKTATEVVSENSQTYKTAQAHKDNLRFALIRLFRAIDIVSGGKGEGIDVVFNDGIIEDRNTKAKYHQDLVLAKLEDTVTALMAVHGIDEKAAIAMAEKIKAENQTVQPVDLGL